jgi:predicted transcriptional regulator
VTKQETIERSEEAGVDADLSLVVKRPGRGVKAPRQEIEQTILALLDEHGEMSIGDIHRALLEEVVVSYGLVQQIVKKLVQGGKLGKVESRPSRYYRQVAQDEATATQSTSPREMVAAALGRGSRPRPDLGELEAEVPAVAKELGPCTLAELHASLLQRRSATYSTMLTAVRSLESHGYLRRRQRADTRYIYEALGDEQS